MRISDLFKGKTRTENSFIKSQCDTMVISLRAFEQGCQLSAHKDDGKISKEEEKTLRKIQVTTERFRRVLESV